MKYLDEAQRLGKNDRRVVVERYICDTGIAMLEDLYARIP